MLVRFRRRVNDWVHGPPTPVHVTIAVSIPPCLVVWYVVIRAIVRLFGIGG